MKTAIVADCLQQDVSILNAPKRMIFQNGAATPKRPRIIPLKCGGGFVVRFYFRFKSVAASSRYLCDWVAARS